MLATVSDALIVASDVTDTPVWFVFGATTALALVTGALACAAFRALAQLKIARAQLDDAKNDRHLKVFLDFGKRWDTEGMAEALRLETNYSTAKLGRLVARAQSEIDHNFFTRFLRHRAERELVILKRVPNYFEDLAIVTEASALDIKLVSKDFKALALEHWELWSDAVAEYRKTDEWSYSQYELLVTAMRGVEDE